MKITDYIKYYIVGKDVTLSMFDLATAFYDTKFPTKAQRESINKAIATVADGVDIIAINTNDKGYKLLYNPHSDKSVCLASSKRIARAGAFSPDDVVWNKLRFEKDGHSFDKLTSTVKTQAMQARAAKAGNPKQIEQTEEYAMVAPKVALAALTDSFQQGPRIPVPPSKAEVAKAMVTLYRFTMSTENHEGVQGEHKGKLLKFVVEEKVEEKVEVES